MKLKMKTNCYQHSLLATTLYINCLRFGDWLKLAGWRMASHDNDDDDDNEKEFGATNDAFTSTSSLSHDSQGLRKKCSKETLLRE